VSRFVELTSNSSLPTFVTKAKIKYYDYGLGKVQTQHQPITKPMHNQQANSCFLVIHTYLWFYLPALWSSIHAKQ